MLVEIFEHVDEQSQVHRCIAVQYSQFDSQMEGMMRRNYPLFDTVMPGMSDVMKARIQCGSHRTAILILESKS